jgi:hypothetical protein
MSKIRHVRKQETSSTSGNVSENENSVETSPPKLKVQMQDTYIRIRKGEVKIHRRNF